MDLGQHTLAITRSGNIPHTKYSERIKDSTTNLPITHIMARISSISVPQDGPKNYGSLRYIPEELNDRKRCHEAFRTAL